MKGASSKNTSEKNTEKRMPTHFAFQNVRSGKSSAPMETCWQTKIDPFTIPNRPSSLGRAKKTAERGFFNAVIRQAGAGNHLIC